MTHSRNKGNSLELQVAKAFSEAFGMTIRRTPLSGGWSHENPEVSGDLVCTTPGANFPYCVECKNVEGWKLESLFSERHEWFDAWWRQTLTECHDKMPILVFSKAFAPKLACVKASQLPDLPMSYHMILHLNQERLIIMELSTLLYLLTHEVS